MKHHKAFRTALSVSIQRRELYPDMTDHDVIKALHIIAGDLQRKITIAERQRKASRPPATNCLPKSIIPTRADRMRQWPGSIGRAII